MVQFVNERLLLEKRVTVQGTTYYDITDVTISRVTICIAKQEWEEINRIIESDFAIPERKTVTDTDDDIPF